MAVARPEPGELRGSGLGEEEEDGEEKGEEEEEEKGEDYSDLWTTRPDILRILGGQGLDSPPAWG